MNIQVASNARRAREHFQNCIFTKQEYNNYRKEEKHTTSPLETLINSGLVIQIQVMENPRRPRNFYFFTTPKRKK